MRSGVDEDAGVLGLVSRERSVGTSQGYHVGHGIAVADSFSLREVGGDSAGGHVGSLRVLYSVLD